MQTKLTSEQLFDRIDVPFQSPKEVYNVQTLLIGGYTVQVGKNAFSNESLILEHRGSHPHCLWFHALGAGGSHVILCLDGKIEPPEDVIYKVGKLALEYSRSRGVTVRVARLEQLEKPFDAGPGVWHARHFAIQDVC